jgi:membrane AbrB-like protein
MLQMNNSLREGALLADRARRMADWSLLLVCSILLVGAMRAAQLPAALMLGPMIAAIGFALGGTRARLPRSFALGAQTVLGCLIAKAFNSGLLAVLAIHWPTLIGLSAATLVMTAALGLLIARRGWLPGTAAIWGLSPGAASAMVLLADEHGADKRIVALMQYSRIVLVAFAAVAVARALGHPGGSANLLVPRAGPGLWSLPSHELAFLESIALALTGALAAKLTRRSSAALFVPAFGGAALQAAGLMTIELPPLVPAIAFGVIGWYVGLSFTREALAYCLKIFPRMMAAIVAMIVMCGLLSMLLAVLVPNTDPLTAYLSMTPGGMDTAVVIAATTNVSLPLVLAAQLVRLIIVMIAGPSMAKAFASWQRPTRPSSARPPVGSSDRRPGP